MITTLLLDVDGVLVSSAPGFLDALDRDYAWRDDAEAFLHELARTPAETDTLVGEGDIGALIDTVLPHHSKDLDTEEFLNRWLHEGIVVDQDLVDLIGRAGFDAVHLATNQDRRRGTYLAGLFGAQPWLTGALMSFELGVAKPDPRFFTVGLERIGVPAAECLFVDDRAENVEGAAAAGVTGVVYRDRATFETDLRALDLLP